MAFQVILKQNYPDSFASYDTQPGNEAGYYSTTAPSTTRATSFLKDRCLNRQGLDLLALLNFAVAF